MTWQEIQRLDGAVHVMRRHCQTQRGRLWFLSTSRGLERDDIDSIWKRVTKLQGRYGLAKYSVLKFETSGGLHAHIVFVGNNALIGKLRTAAFGASIDVRPVYDPAGLVGYLSKDRTPQAQYGRRLRGGRIKGSHRLEGGGPRVRLSAKLKEDAIAAGLVQPWKQENARRSDTRKDYRKRALTRRAPRQSGQILLFPELSKPVARVVVVDGAPRVNELGRSAIMASDLVLIPVQPSPYDVWASTEIVQLVREAQQFKEKLKSAFVINRKIANTAIGRDVSEALADFGIPVLKTALAQRVLYAESAAQGMAVFEAAPSSDAAAEIRRLVEAIEDQQAMGVAA